MKALVLLLPAVLAGCATSEDYRAYLAAQEGANLRAYAERKPLVEIEAVPGQQITGLKAMRVYLPEQPQKVEQMRPSEWAGIYSTIDQTATPTVVTQPPPVVIQPLPAPTE